MIQMADLQATAAVMASTSELESRLEQHRAELTGYCYRMLGSAFEAEDAVQETLLRAWRSYDRFEGRAALKSWLYRIATNVCLTMLDGRGRRARPMDLSPAGTVDGPLSTLPEATWLEPVPDSRVLPAQGDPAELARARETLRLAFVAALQHLPARQRAGEAVGPARHPPMDEADRALLARYVDAFEQFDIDALVALLHEEATLS